MSNEKIVIIGAGPAGLTAAYELTKHDRTCTVLESDPEYVGGIARTARYKDFRFDIGGHRFFSKNAEIEALWRELLPDDFIEVDRLSPRAYGSDQRGESGAPHSSAPSHRCGPLRYSAVNTKPSRVPSTLIVWPSSKRPARISFASSFCSRCWITRFSGRAPNTGS